MVLILVGEQGTYKSTFIRKLGVNWFSDTFTTVNGKESFEQLQGAWIIEMAELSALKKSEIETVKQFIGKCEDLYRPAYGRTVETFKRQCIFFGTTNDTDFLKDPTGNRRFNPIDIHPENANKSVKDDLDDYTVAQIWAEAYIKWIDGETLYFDEDESTLARAEQHKHTATDERRGVIEAFLEKELPKDWDKKDLFDRRQWLEDPLAKRGDYKRDFVCIAEIWCECLGKEKTDMSRYNTREINDILRMLPDWEFVPSTKNFNIYGKQKYYKRKSSLL
jgi:predicted P-loop ATPase